MASRAGAAATTSQGQLKRPRLCADERRCGNGGTASASNELNEALRTAVTDVVMLDSVAFAVHNAWSGLSDVY